MKFPRAGGILLHPTSLPGGYGIGDLGRGARDFADFLSETGQTYWQMLPLGPTGYGDSPYQCYSAFAGNTMLISPDELAASGLLGPEYLTDWPKLSATRVDYGAVYERKNTMFADLWAEFRQHPDPAITEEFEKFKIEHAWWLDDYAAFRAIRADNGSKPWYEWPRELKLRDPDALDKAGMKLAGEIEKEKLLQYLFFRQWSELKEYCNSLRIKIIGDVPIFVALDSADVWCNRDKFKLNADGSPKVVSGVPPDFFSKTGQLWGNPIYDWETMEKDDFHWWVARFAFALRFADIVRIDHFRGFAGLWEVPAADTTAENGEWEEVPGEEIFEAVKRSMAGFPFIAEDLGVITPDVEELRDSLGIPGMRILQYAFGGDAANRDLPHNYIQNCVAYTGTHDNDTAAGWFDSLEKDGTARSHCLRYLAADGKEINWDMIRAVWASVAHTAIVPLQDVLGLGSDARMNIPASTSGNWNWRFQEGSISDEVKERLLNLTTLFGRDRTKS